MQSVWVCVCGCVCVCVCVCGNKYIFSKGITNCKQTVGAMLHLVFLCNTVLNMLMSLATALICLFHDTLCITVSIGRLLASAGLELRQLNGELRIQHG